MDLVQYKFPLNLFPKYRTTQVIKCRYLIKKSSNLISERAIHIRYLSFRLPELYLVTSDKFAGTLSNPARCRTAPNTRAATSTSHPSTLLHSR